MAAKSIFNNNDEPVIAIGDFESKLSGLFGNTFTIIDISTGKLDLFYTDCRIFTDVDSIDFEFAEEDKDKIKEYTSPSNVFILIYDYDNPDSYAVHCMTIKELTDTIKAAYSRGEFVGNDIYRIVRESEKMVCAKSNQNAFLLKELFAEGNCVIYRNDTPVIVTSETDGKFFFVGLNIDNEVKTTLAFDFGPKTVYSSIYDNPVERLYPFLKNSKVAVKPDYELAESDQGEYKILINHKDLPDKEIILNLSLNKNLTFTVAGAEIVDDYKDTIAIFTKHYNDRVAIINELLDNRLSAHSARLLDIID